MSKIFFISDTHFFHENMYNSKSVFPDSIERRVRPEFENSDEGDAFMLQEWNRVVTPQDKVYFCGDFAFDQRKMQTLKKLNGTKILILGNHDNYQMSRYLELFKRIYSYRNVTRLFDINKTRVVLTHCPSHMSTFYPSQGNTINIHGHIHEKCIMRDGYPDLRYQNVSVELIKYCPMELDELREIIISNKTTYSGRSI